MLTIRLEHDSDCSNPADDEGQWTIYSFSNRHASYRNPADLLEDEHGNLPIGLRRKLDVGLAFFLDYFEHGACIWSLSGSGPQCQWDTARHAGLLVWEHSPKDMGAKTRDERTKDAASFLETYTAWCNGECYGFDIHDDVNDEDVDSCWGFVGPDVDYMFEAIESAIAGINDEIRFTGDSACLADYNKRAQAMLERKASKPRQWTDPVI